MLRREVLVDGTLEVLKELMADPACAAFVLGGGTALALQLGHRVSVDLDLFTGERFRGKALLRRMRPRRGEVRVLNDESDDTLLVTVGGVKVDFLGYFYPRLAESRVVEGVRMLDLPDIAPMKLEAVCGRGARKDFLDIACLLERVSLPTMLQWRQEKFPGHDLFPVLRSLTYFVDAEDEPEPRMLWPLTWEEAKRRIAAAVAEVVRG